MMLCVIDNHNGCRRQQFGHAIQVDQACQIDWQTEKMQQVALVEGSALPCEQGRDGDRIDCHHIAQIDLCLAPGDGPQALFQIDFSVTYSK